MSNKFFESVNTLNKVSYDSLKTLYGINVNAASQIADQQIALANLYLGCMSRQFQLMSSAKDYKEIIREENKLIGEISGKAQGIARNTIDIVNESKDEVSAWAKKGVEKVVAVVPGYADVTKATKAAKAAKAA